MNILFVFIGFLMMSFIMATATPTKTILEILVRQASRWATAAAQDKNPMIAVLHANYGAAYIWALSDISTASQIKDATGVDFHKMAKDIVGIQDRVTKRMARLCPNYAPSPTYLTSIAGQTTGSL